MRKAALLLLFTAAALARTGFWAPANPPRATYVITGRVAADASRLDASETVRFRNTAQRELGRLAFEWSGEPFKLLVNGAAAERVAGVQSPVCSTCRATSRPGKTSS